RFATFEARKEREDEIDSVISAWTANRPAEGVMLQLQAGGVAA
ncbi:MAG TPA: formyl-CoA transferase, partial [Dehalococcoidia bacterium]|nr:formyl-CoA transferase [Dehalococcoidia bacterium]